MTFAPEPRTEIIEGVSVRSAPLSPFASLDLLPELADLIGGALGQDSDAAAAVALARGLSNGKLRAILPQLLAATQVAVTQNNKQVWVPLNETDNINLAFAGRMNAFVGVVAFAFKVTFADFFEGGARAVKALRAGSVTKDSNLSTNDIG